MSHKINDGLDHHSRYRERLKLEAKQRGVLVCQIKKERRKPMVGVGLPRTDEELDREALRWVEEPRRD